MKKIFTISVLVMILITNITAQKVTISGEIHNSPQTLKQVELENISTQELLKTEELNNQKFEVSVKIPTAGFFRLIFSDKAYLLLALKPGDKISLKIDYENMLQPEIIGSNENADFYKEISDLAAISQVEDSIEQVFNANYGVNDTVAAQAVMHYQMMEMQKKISMQSFIQSHPNYLVSLYFTEQLSIDEDFELFKTLSENLSKKYPNNEYVQNLAQKIEKAKTTAIGQIAPDIKLPSPDGKTIALSSLRGKYVLIDFWAAWCGPCRRESPNMVALYNQYHDKGFEIYSVSLDQTKDAWLKAIKDDGLGQWTHVSDLKYWNSEAAREYGVEAIPFTLLLDKEGKIIAKNLRGDELKQKIAELLD